MIWTFIMVGIAIPPEGNRVKVEFRSYNMTQEQCISAKKNAPSAVQQSWGQNIRFTEVNCIPGVKPR